MKGRKCHYLSVTTKVKGKFSLGQKSTCVGVFISSFCQNDVVALQSGLIDMLVILVSRCECVFPAVEDSQDACKIKGYA